MKKAVVRWAGLVGNVVQMFYKFLVFPFSLGAGVDLSILALWYQVCLYFCGLELVIWLGE